MKLILPILLLLASTTYGQAKASKKDSLPEYIVIYKYVAPPSALQDDINTWFAKGYEVIAFACGWGDHFNEYRVIMRKKQKSGKRNAVFNDKPKTVQEWGFLDPRTRAKEAQTVDNQELLYQLQKQNQ